MTISKAIRIVSRCKPFLYLWDLYSYFFKREYSHNHKVEVVRDYIKRYGIDVFVETGTYLGDMIWKVKDIVREIHSIELDEELAKAAQRRFHKFPYIYIYIGNSTTLLMDLLGNKIDPTVHCLFWLDAHYSSGITAKGDMETPVMQELQCILKHPAEHVILIDDAHSFVGQNDYPTIEAVQNLINNMRPDWVFEVRDDIIRIHRSHFKTLQSSWSTKVGQEGFETN